MTGLVTLSVILVGSTPELDQGAQVKAALGKGAWRCSYSFTEHLADTTYS